MRKAIPFLLLFLALPLAAQTPYLVKDINPVSTTSSGSSTPYGFTSFGGRIFFAANDNQSGTELWATGAPAGTTRIADINRGQGSSNPSRFIVVNGKLLFNANDSSVIPGEDLWSTDGSNNGTTPIAIFTGLSFLAPGDRIVYHDKMLFSAGDAVHGRELWITDGTFAGTKLLKDLAPGAASSDPGAFVVFNDLVYFGTAGRGFWKSDGTEAGTVIVKPSVFVFEVVVAGSRMFLSALTDGPGVEPWVSDGTEAGTHLISEGTPGASNSISGLTAFGERILFIGTDAQHGAEPWISDGTAAGTHIVRDINPGPDASLVNPSFAVVGNVAYFAAMTAQEGEEIWKTDGTEAGTTIVRDILPGSEGSAPDGFVAVGTQVFFVASNGVDRTLWVTDGSAAGTRQVKTSERLAVGVSSRSSVVLTNIDGVVFFAGANTRNGYEPWMSDGTDAGTSMIANIASDSVSPSSDPFGLVAAGDRIYFNAWDGTGPVSSDGHGLVRSLWRSDGTSEGTLKLTDSPSNDSRLIPAVDSIFFFKANNEIWTSDGTPAGTVPATAFASRFPSTPFIRFILGDRIFVEINPGDPHPQLWTTTTAPGAPAVSLGISGDGFSEVVGRAMFFSSNGLWSSDGTLAGTHAVVPDLAQPAVGSQAVMGGRLYFIERTPAGNSLWRSDGTFEGTTDVKDFTASIDTLASTGRNVFFTTGTQLWITDGTPSGTHSLPATPIGSLTAVGDRVVFAATDSATGQELWVSDGTADGTHLLRDIYPGAFGSFPTGLFTTAGLAYFAAIDDLHGNELWVTDGTAAGTKLVADIETAPFPGNFSVPGSSNPQKFVRAGERLYFTATTQATGNELWALPLPSTPRLTIDDVRVAEGDAGTTAAHFTVTLSPPSTQTVTVDFATSDDTAVSGSDYDSASGTLTFAAGETSKGIDVQVRGDTTPENNETFFVTLGNPLRATLEKATGVAIIEDDDQIADLSLALDFSHFDTVDVITKATNNGPRTATNIKIASTATPGDVLTVGCLFCPPRLTQLAPGATAGASAYSWGGDQQYLTATVKELQRDPQPSNNSVAWMSHNFMVMDALYLDPGSQANVLCFISTGLAGVNVTVESSNPAVISVPAAVTIDASGMVRFLARGLTPGTSNISIATSQFTAGTLTVDVIPAGTKPRFPGAIQVFGNNAGRFDQPVTITINTVSTAPYTGESATGAVTLTSKGHEVAHVTLTPNVHKATMTYYYEDIGSNPVTISYAGDANFLPVTIDDNLVATIGSVTLIAGAARTGMTATVHVRITGSPSAAPTGSITVSEPGIIPETVMSLTNTSPGVAEGNLTLTNVSAGPHTLTLAYSGDTHYAKSSQSVRIAEARARGVRH